MAESSVPSSAAATPSERVAAVGHRLADWQRRCEAARDRRCVCLLAFQMMYEELADRLAAEPPTFDDPAWVADLAEVFAGLLFTAFEGIDAACAACGEGQPDFTGVSKPWADVYGVLTDPRASVAEDLICAVVAHIGHDLPVALSQVGLATGDNSHVDDFHRINEVLASLTDSVQRAIMVRYAPHLLYLDRLARGRDEFVTDFGMQVSRAIAWYTATRLLDPDSSDETRAAIEAVAERAITAIRRPKRLRHRVLSWTTRTVLRGRRRWPPVPQA